MRDPPCMVESIDNLLYELLAACRFPACGTAIDCAVSGGADSLALLVLGVAAGCTVTAVHVDHGLRTGSDAEADVVHAAADRFGAEFRSVRIVLEPGPNLEARARAARFASLPTGVLTGHTADDLVETVLINMIRGAGLDGMAAMVRSNHHPILGLRRHETHELCDMLGLNPVDDPMNRDTAFRRVRIRSEVLPLLDDVAQRDVVAVIARQTNLIADDLDLLDQLASMIETSDVAAMRAAPVALRRRAMRTWLIASGLNHGYPADANTIDRALAVVAGETPATELAGGWRLRRSRGRLFVDQPVRLEGESGRPTVSGSNSARSDGF